MSLTRLAAMMLMLFIDPTASAREAAGAYLLDSPATSDQLGRLPPNGLHMVLDVTYEKPGSVVDTVGIGGAWAGAFQLDVQGDGRLCLSVYDPQRPSPYRDQSGWHRLRNAEAIAVGQPVRVELLLADDVVLKVGNGPDVRWMRGADRWASASVYVGDCPTDASFAPTYEVNRGMVGRVMIHAFEDARRLTPAVAPSPTVPAATPPTASPAAMSLRPLVSQQVGPSAKPQTVAWQDQVKVTLPGGLLKEPRKVTISAVDNPPRPIHESVRQTAVYDISIEGCTEFEQDIVLELPYAECGLESHYPGEALTWIEYYEPSLESWMPVNATTDPARKRMSVRTRHLTPFAVLQPIPGGDFGLLVGEWIEDSPAGGWPARFLFAIHYNARKVSSGTWAYKQLGLGMRVYTDPLTRPGATRRMPGPAPGRTGTGMSSESPDHLVLRGIRLYPGAREEVPGFIAKVADFALAAAARYRALDLKLYSAPLHIYVAGSSEIPDSYHGAFTCTVGVNTSASVLEDLDTLQYTVAHEIFHNVQRSIYWPHEFGTRRGWLEATAEYAACRIAMDGYRYMGKLDKPHRQMRLANYLTKDLTYFRVFRDDSDPWQNHEYAASCFLDRVCLNGARQLHITPKKYFAKMFKWAAANGDWDGLAAFLGQHGSSLAEQYADFAVFYLFDAKSPICFKTLVPASGGTQPVISYQTDGPPPERSLAALLTLAEDAKPQEHRFELTEKLTSKVIQVQATAPIKKKWAVKTELAGDLPADTVVTVARLRNNDRRAGVELKRFPATGGPVAVHLDAADGLYIIASAARPASVTVKVTAESGMSPAPTPETPKDLTLKTWDTADPSNPEHDETLPSTERYTYYDPPERLPEGWVKNEGGRVRHGSFRRVHRETGKVLLAAEYDHGHLHNTQECSTSDGTLLWRQRYDRGKMLEESSFFKDGRLSATVTYANHRTGPDDRTVADGHFVSYFENGTEAVKGDFIGVQVGGNDGRGFDMDGKNGRWIVRFEDGSPAIESAFKDNKPIGPWVEYERPGVLKRTGQHNEQGLRAGTWFSYEAGKKRWYTSYDDRGVETKSGMIDGP